jgi:hypothetical protein
MFVRSHLQTARSWFILTPVCWVARFKPCSVDCSCLIDYSGQTRFLLSTMFHRIGPADLRCADMMPGFFLPDGLSTERHKYQIQITIAKVKSEEDQRSTCCQASRIQSVFLRSADPPREVGHCLHWKIEALQGIKPKACTQYKGSSQGQFNWSSTDVVLTKGLYYNLTWNSQRKKGMKHEEEQICPAQSISHHAATQKRYSSSCYGVCR